MTRKILLFLMITSSLFREVLAQKMPSINSSGLPGDNDQEGGYADTFTNDPFERFMNIFIESFIEFVGVAAVLALILSGMQLILSGGEEEKMKKARTWFIWSLVGVIISLLAFFIINFINNLDIG